MLLVEITFSDILTFDFSIISRSVWNIIEHDIHKNWTSLTVVIISFKKSLHVKKLLCIKQCKRLGYHLKTIVTVSNKLTDMIFDDKIEIVMENRVW